MSVLSVRNACFLQFMTVKMSGLIFFVKLTYLFLDKLEKIRFILPKQVQKKWTRYNSFPFSKSEKRWRQKSFPQKWMLIMLKTLCRKSVKLCGFLVFQPCFPQVINIHRLYFPQERVKPTKIHFSVLLHQKSVFARFSSFVAGLTLCPRFSLTSVRKKY